MKYMGVNIPVSRKDINIIDGYVGRGYALSRPEELRFIQFLSKLEGIILDPVYTGKAMYGLAEEIKKGTFINHKNILFIHTGGLFGLFPQGSLFEF
jgi:D-cysteine desulfhydrase